MHLFIPLGRILPKLCLPLPFHRSPLPQVEGISALLECQILHCAGRDELVALRDSCMEELRLR